jgi:ribosomal protein S14
MREWVSSQEAKRLAIICAMMKHCGGCGRPAAVVKKMVLSLIMQFRLASKFVLM